MGCEAKKGIISRERKTNSTDGKEIIRVDLRREAWCNLCDWRTHCDGSGVKRDSAVSDVNRKLDRFRAGMCREPEIRAAQRRIRNTKIKGVSSGAGCLIPVLALSAALLARRFIQNREG